MKGKTVVLSTALAGMLAAASAAQAAVDAKVYPGNACNVEFGNEAADIHNHTIFIHNVGAVNRSVVCPIVRDNHKNLNGVKSVGVRVQSDGVNTLTCFLETWTALGAFVVFDSNSTTSSAVVNLPLDIDTSTKAGTYSLACVLPPNGAVYGYRVNEF